MSPRARQVISVAALLGVLLLASGAESGQGWYLLGQPWFYDKKTGQMVHGSDFPVSEMEQLAAFESAGACETERLARSEQATKEAWDAARKLTQAQELAARGAAGHGYIATLEEALQSKTQRESWTFTCRCVSASDPRLGAR